MAVKQTKYIACTQHEQSDTAKILGFYWTEDLLILNMIVLLHVQVFYQQMFKERQVSWCLSSAEEKTYIWLWAQ